MYEEELERIIKASQENALTFFIGAGVSRISGIPGWNELINQISIELGRTKKDEYSSDEMLQIPQMFYYLIGKDEKKYYSFIRNILSVHAVPNAIHREIIKLNPASIITTNYDELIEEAAMQARQGYKVVTCDKDVPQIYGYRYILKMHGDFKHNNIVLKEEDYLAYSDNFRLIETLVKSVFSINTVVFIGYGLNDYNIKLILNWAKTILKDSFHKPIFIYTGKEKIHKEERYYYESRGLSVIDCNWLCDTTDDYSEKYLSFFNTLNCVSKPLLEGMSSDEAFDWLYNQLLPLDQLHALRRKDISNILFPYIYIDAQGIIVAKQNNILLLEKFAELCKYSQEQKANISKEIIEKNDTIQRVLLKARIYAVKTKEGICKLSDNYTEFGDVKCLQFDFLGMKKFVKKQYNNRYTNFKKAFYLSRLNYTEEAYKLFHTIAKEAFTNKDYLWYYLAEANCISLEKIIDYRKNLLGTDDPDNLDTLTIREVEELYDRLPVEFKNQYKSLNGLHLANIFYEYAYESFADGQKAEKAIDLGSIEFGETSNQKVVNHVNEYLHFFLGNGIVSDIFLEYKNTVKHLMSLVVRKYATQGKKIIRFQEYPITNNCEAYFDDIGFYCFVNSFTSKEINELFTKYHIENIEFQHTNEIEASINNIIDYYRYAQRHPSDHIDIFNLQVILCSCIRLLQYMDISQKLVDILCVFLLNNEFRFIDPIDIVRFVESQVYKRKKISKVTIAQIEQKFYQTLDYQINLMIDNDSNHNRLSSDAFIKLIYCIRPEICDYKPRKLASRVLLIIKNDLISMRFIIGQLFLPFMTENIKKK